MLYQPEPLRPDAHDDVRGHRHDQERPEGKAPHPAGVGCAPGGERRDRAGRGRPDEHHRPDHVQEEGEVERVGPDRCERAHAQGFQIMSRRTRSTAPGGEPVQQPELPRPQVGGELSARLLGLAAGHQLGAAVEALLHLDPRAAARLEADHPQHDRGDDPEVEDRVRVEREREPDAEHDRPDRARDHRDLADLGDGAEGHHLARAIRASQRGERDREQHDGARKTEGAEQMEGQDPVVEAHGGEELNVASRRHARG